MRRRKRLLPRLPHLRRNLKARKYPLRNLRMTEF